MTIASLDKWDVRFMKLAQEVSTWSKDPSTKTGAVLVSPDRRDVILGYNGFPARMEDRPELYADREQKYDRIIHCEMNAVLQAQRSVKGYTLYTWPFLSCSRCAAHMVAAGISRVVAPLPSPDGASRWADAFRRSRQYFAEAFIEVVEYSHPGLSDAGSQGS